MSDAFIEGWVQGWIKGLWIPRINVALPVVARNHFDRDFGREYPAFVEVFAFPASQVISQVTT